MKTWLSLLLLVVGCGPALQPDCRCEVMTSGGLREFACGGSLCASGDGYRCSTTGIVSRDAQACLPNQPAPTCTPKTCNGACGSMPDGCGGTLTCATCAAGQRCTASNTCESPCAGVTCGQGQRCEPTTGQCQADACTQANAVCGVVNGQTCGTCPGGSVCSSTKRLCIETVATLPNTQYVFSAVIAGDQLFVATTASLNQGARDLVAVDLTSKQPRSVATGKVFSPLTVKNGSVFWGEAMGLRRLDRGMTTPSTIPGLDYGCSDLVVSGQFIYCGIGGDARYGLSGLGIKKLPVAGGVATWARSYLNFPHLAAVGQYVFYVGTTDNQYSFKNLGAYDTTANDDQVVVSGGSLDSKFVMADTNAFYFVEYRNADAVLARAPFDSTTSIDLLKGSSIQRETTVLQASAIFTIAKVGAEQGLWKVSLNDPAQRALVLNWSDLHGTAQDGPSHLLSLGDGWLFISGSTVYRTVAPNQ